MTFSRKGFPTYYSIQSFRVLSFTSLPSYFFLSPLTPSKPERVGRFVSDTIPVGHLLIWPSILVDGGRWTPSWCPVVTVCVPTSTLLRENRVRYLNPSYRTRRVTDRCVSRTGPTTEGLQSTCEDCYTRYRIQSQVPGTATWDSSPWPSPEFREAGKNKPSAPLTLNPYTVVERYKERVGGKRRYL